MSDMALTKEQQAVFDETMAMFDQGKERVGALIPDKLLIHISRGGKITIEQLAEMMTAAWVDGFAASRSEKQV